MLNHFNINLHLKFVFQEHQVKDGTALEFLMDLLSTLKVLNFAYSVLSPGMCIKNWYLGTNSFFLPCINSHTNFSPKKAEPQLQL